MTEHRNDDLQMQQAVLDIIPSSKLIEVSVVGIFALYTDEQICVSNEKLLSTG